MFVSVNVVITKIKKCQLFKFISINISLVSKIDVYK